MSYQFALAAVIVLGAAAQWLAWALRIPSILFLLLFGFLAGPILGWVSPTALFGDLLLPLVSIAVALILFEGGLSLSFREIRGSAGVITLLVTVGALVTWALAGAAAHLLLGLDFEIAALLGAILTVTGPTVVLPLLRHIRPSAPLDAILKWEGIVIDPIGALLAVLVFEGIRHGTDGGATHFAAAIGLTVLGGGAIGLVAAAVLAYGIRRYVIPDHLQTAVALMLVVGAFVGANAVHPESGLLAVTVMGIALANQRFADMRHVLEFKENLRVFLLSAVFILLSARVRLSEMQSVGGDVLLFVLALILVVRPACVALSTMGSSLSWRQRAFLACVAPRGIVAAAVTSVFALELERLGHSQARLLVPVIFSTIVVTVVTYGLLGSPIARRMHLSDSNPQGFLIVGANRFARQLARVLQAHGVRVVLVDSNRNEVLAARGEQLPAHFGSILTEEAREKLDLTGIGRLLALTSNDEVNALACERFARIFGRAGVYRLPGQPRGAPSRSSEPPAPGRPLFARDATYWRIEALGDAGGRVAATRLRTSSDYAALQAQHAGSFVPLLIVQNGPFVQVVVVGEKAAPRAGATVIALAAAPSQAASAGPPSAT